MLQHIFKHSTTKKTHSIILKLFLPICRPHHDSYIKRPYIVKKYTNEIVFLVAQLIVSLEITNYLSLLRNISSSVKVYPLLLYRYIVSLVHVWQSWAMLNVDVRSGPAGVKRGQNRP